MCQALGSGERLEKGQRAQELGRKKDFFPAITVNKDARDYRL